MPPLGSERSVVEPRRLNRALLRLLGWRQLGPRVRYWHISRALDGRQPRRVFEAGCGWGQNLFALQRRFPQATMVGVDADAVMIVMARQIAAQLPGLQPTFVVGDLHTVSLEGMFDLILMSDVLEYLSDDQQVLRRCHDWLVPGGRFVLHVPRRITEQRRILPVSHETPGHVRPEYTKEEIVAKMHTAGFKLPQVRETFGWWGTLAWESFRLCERRLRPLSALAFPKLLGIARLDCWGRIRNGNGYLLVAHRRGGD